MDVYNDIDMILDEAKELKAIGVFDNKYGNRVKIYTMLRYCNEICGGPHTS